MSEMITNKTEIIKRAIELYEQGYTVLPTQNFTKHPCIKWETYQHRRPTLNRLLQLFGMNNVTGLCVLTGKLEGKNVYHMVLELEAEIANLSSLVCKEIRKVFTENHYWVEESNSGGYHFHFLIESDKEVDCLRSRKLVLNSEGKTLVETRGQGGLIVVAPTPEIGLGTGWKSLPNVSGGSLPYYIHIDDWMILLSKIESVIAGRGYVGMSDEGINKLITESKSVDGSFSVEVKVTPKNRAEKISHLLALFGVPDALIEQIEAECSR